MDRLEVGDLGWTMDRVTGAGSRGEGGSVGLVDLATELVILQC